MKRTVLVIDDNPDLLDMVDAILSDTGFLVAKTVSGEEGLTVARTLRPNLILLDLNMPRMDGWEVLKLLKADAVTQEIPVAIFSVQDRPKDKIFGLQRGPWTTSPSPSSTSTSPSASNASSPTRSDRARESVSQ